MAVTADSTQDDAVPSKQTSQSESTIPVHSPPSKRELFELTTAAPPLSTSVDDPRVSLRPLSTNQLTTLLRGKRRFEEDDEPLTLNEFRQNEDPATRLSVFRRLFDSLPMPTTTTANPSTQSASTSTASETVTPTLPDFEPTTDERQLEADRKTYARELWRKCSSSTSTVDTKPVESAYLDDRENSKPGSSSSGGSDATPSTATTSSTTPAAPLSSQAARWTAFERYADEKERELWRAFIEMDRDGDMRLRKDDVKQACKRAGVPVKDDSVIDEFIRNVDKNGDGAISFEEWRNFFLLLPRQTDMSEMWKYYQTHRSRRPSMSRLTQDGDVVIGGGKSSWDRIAGRAATRERSSSKSSTDQTSTSSSSTSSLTKDQIRERTNLKQLEPDNDEKKFATACRRVRTIKLRELEEEQHQTDLLRIRQREEQLRIQEEQKRQKEADREMQARARSVSLREDDAGAEEQGTVSSLAVEEEEEEDEPEPMAGMLSGAGKFLLAGGLAGAVSRTATAPFDRLKVYLITQGKEPIEAAEDTSKDLARKVKRRKNAGSLPAAVRAVLKQGGGIKAFWTGNGLNVIKIFPESAIKFLSYESAKRVFAQYWDHVPDQTLISNSSRFVAGGIGGVVSQFVIYPIESLKTRVMSSTGGALRGNALILKTAADMWAKGGIPFFFRGLPAGLVGVFPYSAIDMSTFEGIKLAYTKWAGSEPGVIGSLSFGALSGGIGATSVYPLNVIRTRLQAQGTPAHPQVYTGVKDAAYRCYVNDGWRGFYKGLTPTLVKVVPAVAISYAVYDTSKKVLFGREENNCHALQQHQDDDSDES
ncbi:hypothetical protein OIO90_004598 [Microbotryomycetes sp. JL221]|nr:hypothetical protein OIO90_004598 [Microbotryomycetes sp. JL221]